MGTTLWLLLCALVLLRAGAVRRFWRLPTALGPGKFFLLAVPGDFYGGAGGVLLRRYHRALLAPLVLDVAVIVGLFALDRPVYVFYAQGVAAVVSAVYFRMAAAHYGVQARALLELAAPAAPTAVQISVESRRLRDHLNWWVEAPIAALLLAGVICMVQQRAAVAAAWGHGAHHREAVPGSVQKSVDAAVWLLYAQLGLLFVKQLFVRARLRLPLRRAEEFLRWRAAWLRYHLRIVDLFRALLAAEFAILGLPLLVPSALRERVADPLLVGWLLGAALVIALALRERRRLAQVEREVPPAELAREFPPSPVAAGRFAVGGFAYLERDNPAILVRGPSGLAVNVANRATYLWLVYLVGLAALVLLQALR